MENERMGWDTGLGCGFWVEYTRVCVQKGNAIMGVFWDDDDECVLRYAALRLRHGALIGMSCTGNNNYNNNYNNNNNIH